MTLPTDPALVAGAVAVTVAVVAWFAHTILGMRDTLRDVHTALFGLQDTPGALARINTHEARHDETDRRLGRHSDALRALGALTDD